MDPITVATGVLTVLTPFLVEGGKAAARKAGEALWAALEKRFKGNPAAETALVDLKATPEDADNQAALRKEIRKLAEADAAFKAELEKLLAAAEAEAPGSVHIEVRDGAAALPIATKPEPPPVLPAVRPIAMESLLVPVTAPLPMAMSYADDAFGTVQVDGPPTAIPPIGPKTRPVEPIVMVPVFQH